MTSARADVEAFVKVSADVAVQIVEQRRGSNSPHTVNCKLLSQWEGCGYSTMLHAPATSRLTLEHARARSH